MKTTIRMENPDGSISEEHEIELSDDDQLIFKFTDQRMYLQFMKEIERNMEIFRIGFKKKVIVLPPYLELKVLRKTSSGNAIR